MKRLLYPLIASALITIIPFLLTFEKGQDIIRGLFGYEYFALLLLITFVKSKLKKVTFTRTIILVVFIAILFAIAWIDLQNQLFIKGWSTGWFGSIPFVTCGLAVAMVWTLKSFKFNAICFILFITLVLHLETHNHYAAQPLVQFPTIDYLERIAPKPVQRNEITKKIRQKYAVTDSVTITRDFVDTTRNNVVILVESWGVPLDIERFEKELNIFKGITTAKGIHNRMYSRTRTAEREDLIYKINHDSITKKRDTLFLPKVFANIGFKTTFLFGGDSLEQYRYKYINNIGFDKAIYGKLQNGGDMQQDAQMLAKIDSILTDTRQKHFIAWTTSDTRFPMGKFYDLYNSDVGVLDSTYRAKLHNDFTMITDLAHQHPETRFIIQGDHNPILSPIRFQEKFYKRWVPFIILN